MQYRLIWVILLLVACGGTVDAPSELGAAGAGQGGAAGALRTLAPPCRRGEVLCEERQDVAECRGVEGWISLSCCGAYCTVL